MKIDMLIYEEIGKVYPDTAAGELENMVKRDMKASDSDSFAAEQGWLQDGFDEMEIVG